MRLGGLTEVADALDVSTQRIAALRQRPDFPDPVGEIAQGPIWDLDVVAEWSGSGLRRTRAGRPPAELLARTLGGRFVLEPNAIGRGGFAEVFRATDRKTGNLVAVKVLRETAAVDPESIKRFQRELQLLESLDHPNVISIVGQGATDKEDIWYAMPLAQGSLTDFIGEIGGNEGRIIDVMRQVCAGLSHVHAQGVLHRDLKPANVLRLANGDWAVSDFGLAVEAERHTSPLTSTLRSGMGSWIYTAPEQWTQARSADLRSDIYSLGKVLQELATQEYPVTSEIPPGRLRPVISTAIASEPASRYQSVDQFREALDRAVEVRQQYASQEHRDETAERLRDRLRSPSTAEADLTEMIEWAATLDESDSDDMTALTRVLPWCSRSSMNYLWRTHRTPFRRVYQHFTDHVRDGDFSFEYCDVLADFGERAVTQTKDSSIFRMTISALATLGYRHNRWHVRDVLIGMLQGIKSEEMAFAAVEALQSIEVEEVDWAITEFAGRTLHPAVRTGLNL